MDWMKRELLTGFQRLLTLGLDRQPAAEVIPGTVSTWFDALTHGRVFDEERDAPRFRAAFRTLASRCRNWPSPADFIEAMPRIETPAPARRITSGASRDVVMRHIAELSAKLRIDPAATRGESDQ
jgi:hypothetical protein